jgi:hypothetical protein
MLATVPSVAIAYAMKDEDKMVCGKLHCLKHCLELKLNHRVQ